MTGLQHRLERRAPWELIQAAWTALQQEPEKLTADLADLDVRAAAHRPLTAAAKRAMLRTRAVRARELMEAGIAATPDAAR